MVAPSVSAGTKLLAAFFTLTSIAALAATPDTSILGVTLIQNKSGIIPSYILYEQIKYSYIAGAGSEINCVPGNWLGRC